MESWGAAYIVVMLFLFVLAVLWLLLPFAMFGMKPLLREMVAEMKKNNALLSEALNNSSALPRRDITAGRAEPIVDAVPPRAQ